MAGAVVSIALALPAGAQTLGCTTGGGGGPIPTSGTGGGTAYPTTFPPYQLDVTINVTSVPAGAAGVTEVKLFGLTHTWVADLQFVLTDPAGARYNIYCRPPYSCDYGGDYVIVGECGGGMGQPGSCIGIYPPGTYDQYYGTWPSGTQSVNNVSLYAIPPQTGTWTLTVYDWAGADVGALTSWDLCFGSGSPPAPVTAPTLTAPANGATACSPVNFAWTTVSCATSYDIDIDGAVTNVLSNNHSASLGVGPHTWSVRANNASGNGPWSAANTLNVATAPATMTCIAGGGGGPIPTSGTGDGAWPNTLPSYPLVTPLAVTVPTGASQIVAVKLNGLDHTWIGDLHFVLQEPAGQLHTLVHRPGLATGSTCCGLNCDPFGDYVIYEACPGQDWPTTCAGGVLPAGDYVQYFGTWPTGTNGILNTPLGAIPISSGTWNLYVYDWAGGDIGTMVSWELCFDSGSTPPPSYCTPSGPNSDGCTTAISAPAEPNTSHTSGCVITVTDLPGVRNAILFYGVNGSQAVNWCAPGQGTSQLCVIGPPWRTGIQDTGGTAGLCDGTMVLDWDAYQLGNPGALGQPWSVGDQAWVQGWYRAPQDCRTTSLTEALELTYQ